MCHACLTPLPADHMCTIKLNVLDVGMLPYSFGEGFYSTFRRACRVKSSIPIEVVFRELSVTRWHDFLVAPGAQFLECNGAS